MENPLVKKDLIDAILELRADVERELQANKYYVALHKLDELLDAIRPLEIIEATVNPTEKPSPVAEPVAQAAPQGEAERTWTGVVQETVGEPSWQPAPAQASGDELRAS
jgi:hypothetical protein